MKSLDYVEGHRPNYFLLKSVEHPFTPQSRPGQIPPTVNKTGYTFGFFPLPRLYKKGGMTSLKESKEMKEFIDRALNSKKGKIIPTSSVRYAPMSKVRRNTIIQKPAAKSTVSHMDNINLDSLDQNDDLVQPRFNESLPNKPLV